MNLDIHATVDGSSTLTPDYPLQVDVLVRTGSESPQRPVVSFCQNKETGLIHYAVVRFAPSEEVPRLG